VRKNYQRKQRTSNHKFEVVGGQELLVQVPLPMAEVWAEMQAKMEELAGQARLQILWAILENEVTQPVAPPHRPNPSVGCVRWGKQPGYVVTFGGQVLVVALGIAESGEKHVLGVWQGATENSTVVKEEAGDDPTRTPESSP
jgi:hypothetical protein